MNWAVSTGRRNITIMRHHHELVLRFCGRPPTECLSRSAIQGNCDGLKIVRAVLAEIRALRELLPEEAVRVHVGAALPRAVRITEADRQPREDLQVRMPRPTSRLRA